MAVCAPNFPSLQASYRIIARNSNWFIRLLASVVIGQSKLLWYWFFSTVISKPLNDETCTNFYLSLCFGFRSFSSCLLLIYRKKNVRYANYRQSRVLMTAWNWIAFLRIPHTVSRFCRTILVVSVKERCKYRCGRSQWPLKTSVDQHVKVTRIKDPLCFKPKSK